MASRRIPPIELSAQTTRPAITDAMLAALLVAPHIATSRLKATCATLTIFSAQLEGRGRRAAVARVDYGSAASMRNPIYRTGPAPLLEVSRALAPTAASAVTLTA